MNRDMTRLDLAEQARVIGAQPYPLVFATVSGAHLYGFPSRDSDVDLRGAHALPLPELVGLRQGPETITRTWDEAGMEVDLVTHELAKFLGMLRQRNGYVLEQLLSPLVVTTSPLHAELVALAPRLVTRHHARHYLGFTASQRRLWQKNREVKPLLYTFRAVLTGLHLMATGEVQAHLPTLLTTTAGVPGYVAELVVAKVEHEHLGLGAVASAPGVEAIEADVDALITRLEAAAEATALPDHQTADDALHSLLLAARLG